MPHDEGFPSVGYVCGTSFTGITLLSFLLNAHDDIACVGHVVRRPGGDAATFPCSCGRTLGECPFWAQVGDEMRGRGQSFDPAAWGTNFRLSDRRIAHQVLDRSLRSNVLDRARDGLVNLIPGWKRTLDGLGARNAALFGSIAAVADASVFVDASQDSVRVSRLQRYAGVQPFVVHLVRDAPGFASSNMTNHPERSIDLSIRTWNRKARQCERLRRTMPEDRWLRVRYEDICADPDGEMGKIFSFLEVAPERRLLDFRKADHHILGNRMRLVDSTEIKLDTAWQTRLTAEQIAQIERGTHRYRKALGYAD